MKNTIYHHLQKHLDKHPIAFPATDSGSEIRVLQSLFSEEEAELTLKLSALPERASKIHKRLGRNISLADLENSLDRMYKKGLILRKQNPKDTETYLYQKMPLAVGIFEAQVDKLTTEFAESYLAYEKEAFAECFVGSKTNQLRTIPLNVKVDPDFQVSNYDDISEIIKNSPGPFAVMNCICRQIMDTVDRSCEKSDTRETCILVEEGVEFALNLSQGKQITKEETLQLIKQAKKKGFVLQPENNQHPHFVCCCCGCCCQVLRAAKHFEKPAEFLHSNYYAEVNAEKCGLCETCLERCSMDAFDRVNKHMEINLDHCIGCGACVPTCKSKAIRLKQKENQIIPPVSNDDMYKKIMMERFGLGGSLKVMAKATLGMKV